VTSRSAENVGVDTSAPSSWLGRCQYKQLKCARAGRRKPQ
jgi:hypothetical protein